MVVSPLRRPLERLCVAPLVPVRQRNLQQYVRREWIALERALLHREPGRELSQGLAQLTAQQLRLRVARFEVERAIEAPRGRVPVPLAQQQHAAERRLRIRAAVV